MKTILIAGGAGFIGIHLCKRLLKEGNRVICLDNCSTGREERVRPFLSFPDFVFVRHDVTAPCFIKESVDEIYNLACPASPLHYQRMPVETLKASVYGAVNLWSWLSVTVPRYCKLLQARCMVAPTYIHRRKIIGDVLILLDHVPVTMRASGRRKPFSWITAVNMASALR